LHEGWRGRSEYPDAIAFHPLLVVIAARTESEFADSSNNYVLIDLAFNTQSGTLSRARSAGSPGPPTGIS
jgi:hypothetical protein